MPWTSRPTAAVDPTSETLTGGTLAAQPTSFWTSPQARAVDPTSETLTGGRLGEQLMAVDPTDETLTGGRLAADIFDARFGDWGTTPAEFMPGGTMFSREGEPLTSANMFSREGEPVGGPGFLSHAQSQFGEFGPADPGHPYGGQFFDPLGRDTGTPQVLPDTALTAGSDPALSADAAATAAAQSRAPPAAQDAAAQAAADTAARGGDPAEQANAAAAAAQREGATQQQAAAIAGAVYDAAANQGTPQTARSTEAPPPQPVDPAGKATLYTLPPLDPVTAYMWGHYANPAGNPLIGNILGHPTQRGET